LPSGIVSATALVMGVENSHVIDHEPLLMTANRGHDQSWSSATAYSCLALLPAQPVTAHAAEGRVNLLALQQIRGR
jgi:hypothetical protein